MEAQKPLEQETPETTPQEVPTATIPQPESTPAANMEADPVPEEMDASPKSPAKKTAGKLAALIGGGIVAVLGIFYLVLCIVSASHGTILGRTDVMGVDMSGLTVPQAQERWQQKGQAVCQATQLPLTVDGETAGQVSLWELGVSVTPETAAQLAYDAGHSGHFLENGWSLLRSWFRETSLTPPWTADDAALQEKAAELAEQLDVAAIDGACRLEQGKEDGFLVTVPKNGRKIDPRQLADALRAALAAAAVANYLITPGLLCAVLMGAAALVITNGLQILLMTYQQGVAFSAASSLAGREILVTLPLTALVYLPFRWVRRRIYSE